MVVFYLQVMFSQTGAHFIVACVSSNKSSASGELAVCSLAHFLFSLRMSILSTLLRGI